MAEDNNQNLWVGTSDGLYKSGNDNFTIIPTPTGMNYITTIFLDKNNNIWIGAYNNGVAKYDGKDWTPYTPNEKLFRTYVFSSNFFADSKGNIWFGTLLGALKFDGQNWTDVNIPGIGFFLEKKKIGVRASFLEDDLGNVYIAGRSFGCYDGQNLKVYKKENGLSKNIIHSMAKDKDNNIWLGHYAGKISKFNGTDFEKIKLGGNYYNWNAAAAGMYIGILPGFILGACLPNPDDGCYLINDSKNNIWAACHGSGGSVFKFQDNKWIKFKNRDGLSRRTKINLILEDKSSKIWIASHKRDVIAYDGTKWTNYNKQLNGIVKNLYVDRQNNIWVGTTEGLVKLENK